MTLTVIFKVIVVLSQIIFKVISKGIMHLAQISGRVI